MHTRENALNQWIQQQLKQQPFTLRPLAGDASHRRYFRLISGSTTRIVMDAPPKLESIQPFIDVNHHLQHNGITTPTVHAVDLNQGFALLDDFGDTLFLNALRFTGNDSLYFCAIDTLIQLQRSDVVSTPLPDFDPAHMIKEMSLFDEWFIGALLKLTLSPAEQKMINTTYQWLSDHLCQQAQVFIHRDYHSRNLMLLGPSTELQLGVIDFQDAMRGPVTYDLVSLLKDCYHRLPETAYRDYADYFYQHQPLIQTESLPTFLEQLDFCGLQRHLKVLGIFSRLHLRDQKPAYLNDLPLTLDYVINCLQKHSELNALHTFTQQRILPCFKTRLHEQLSQVEAS